MIYHTCLIESFSNVNAHMVRMVHSMDALHSFINTSTILPHPKARRHVKIFDIGNTWVVQRIFRLVQLSIVPC